MSAKHWVTRDGTVAGDSIHLVIFSRSAADSSNRLAHGQHAKRHAVLKSSPSPTLQRTALTFSPTVNMPKGMLRLE